MRLRCIDRTRKDKLHYARNFNRSTESKSANTNTGCSYNGCNVFGGCCVRACVGQRIHRLALETDIMVSVKCDRCTACGVGHQVAGKLCSLCGSVRGANQKALAFERALAKNSVANRSKRLIIWIGFVGLMAAAWFTARWYFGL